MSNLSEFIENDKKATQELNAAIEEAKEFLEKYDYEVHTKGAYCGSVAEYRRDNPSTRGGNRILKI